MYIKIVANGVNKFMLLNIRRKKTWKKNRVFTCTWLG